MVYFWILLLPSKHFCEELLNDFSLRRGSLFKLLHNRPDSIHDLQASFQSVDPEFNPKHSDKVSQKLLTAGLKEFMSHCYREHHYICEIKKCGESDCMIYDTRKAYYTPFVKIRPFSDPVLN